MSDAKEESQGKHAHISLCRYCGNNVDRGKEYHEECYRKHLPKCRDAVYKFRKISASQHTLWMGIHVTCVFKPLREKEGKTRVKKGEKGERKKDTDYKVKRSKKIKELLDKASALRNSGSGHILIHLVGLAQDDNFTGAFDEFVDVKLNGLINDGSSFDDVYTKQKLSAFRGEEFQGYKDILVLSVDGAKCLVTSDIKTKSALDDSIIDTPDLTLLQIINSRRKREERFQDAQSTFEDLDQLQESRCVQTKAFMHSNDTTDSIVETIFNFKLAEYISAFTKLQCGGSYYLGVGEEQRDYVEPGYQSKILVAKPFAIHNCREVEKTIKERVSETLHVCDYDGEEKTSHDLIKVFFIPSRQSDSFIIHISVRPVNGIVFYDKQGPLVYKVTGNPSNITRVSFGEWFTDVKRRLQQ